MATILGKLSANNLGELRNLTGLPDLTGYYNCITQYIYQKRQETVVLKIQSDEDFEVIDLQHCDKQQLSALERLLEDDEDNSDQEFEIIDVIDIYDGQGVDLQEV